MFIEDGVLGEMIAKTSWEAFTRWRKLALVIENRDMQREGWKQ